MKKIAYTQHLPLLVRTAIQPGESLQSLLTRLSRLNDYDIPDTLFQILQEGVSKQQALKDRIALPRRIEMYQRLEALTGIDIPDHYAASAHRFANILTPPDISIELLEISEGISTPLLSWSLATKQLRPASAGQFCPHCLRSAVYHRLIWLPIAVSACLEHSCLLIDRCQRCGKKVSIREIVQMQCRKCKDILAGSEVLPLGNDAGLALQRVIQSWFLNNTTPDDAPLFPEAQPRVLYRVLDGLQWATRMLAWTEWSHLHCIDGDPHMAILQPGKGQNTITPYESYRLYTTAFRGMTNWPEGFYEFLRAYQMQQQSGNLHNGGPKADLGNLYTQWLQDYWKHSAFEFVHKAFEWYFVATYPLSSAVARTNLCQENTGMMEQLSGVSTAEAARLLGVTPKMIDILLRTGRLTLQLSGSTGKRIHRFMNRTQVLELRSQWNEFVNRAEAAEWLGITERMVIDLVNVGLLVAERNPGEGYPHWAFHKSALVDCMEKVLKCVESCVPDKIGEKGTFVDLAGAARMLFVVGLNAASILSYVAEGKLRAYFSADCDPKLTSLLFDRSDIQQCILSMKMENGWVSREDVTKLLKVKDITLARWVKFGLISPAAVYGSAQYFDWETIEAFIADHITTEEAANLLGVGKLTVQKWTREGRLARTCVGGPTVDGGHTYLFEKKKLVQWRKERLSFGEAVQLLEVSKATLHCWVDEGKIKPLDDMNGKQRWFSKQSILALRTIRT
jgi:excisionase family DNA binding protein